MSYKLIGKGKCGQRCRVRGSQEHKGGGGGHRELRPAPHGGLHGRQEQNLGQQLRLRVQVRLEDYRVKVA